MLLRGEPIRARAGVLIDVPEVLLACSAFFLNFFWEMAQSPLYRDVTERSYGEMLASRLHCTLGDVVILLGAHAIVAWTRRDRHWVMRLRGRDLTVFTGLGLSYTVLSEWVNMDLRSAWSYDPVMPRVPLLGT